MAFDFKKEYKEFYMSKSVPEIVTVPKANYIAVRGMGDPNQEGGAYQSAVSILYAVAYTLKMSYKTDYRIEGFFEYVVPPLEGFWWQEGVDGIDYGDKSTFHWISVIRPTPTDMLTQQVMTRTLQPSTLTGRWTRMATMSTSRRLTLSRWCAASSNTVAGLARQVPR